MNRWIALWQILRKDMRTYYLKPPNISWGLIFPLAWTAMWLIRSGQGVAQTRTVLPGIVGVSILFGTTSMLAVTVTFEKKNRSFERLLLAPIPLELLMLAKVGGAIVFGTLNAGVPVAMAAALTELEGVNWGVFASAVFLIAVASALWGLFIAVSVSEVFEAQTFSNFFRFPMIFLCGLFMPVASLPLPLRPLAYVLPLTYGGDILHGAVSARNAMPMALDFAILVAFCVGLFVVTLFNIRRKWIR